MEDNNSPTVEMEQTKISTITIRKRVMIAGVGNMFMKDDGFGGAVIKKILGKKLPEGVEVKDFGTGGLKLAYDLM
jgi:hydrogenase maturation protease